MLTLQPVPAVPAPVRTLAFVDAGDHTLLVTAGAPRPDDAEPFPARETLEARHTVRVWDVATGAPAGPALVGHVSWVTTAAGFTTGAGEVRIVTGSVDGTLRVWDAATGTEVCPPVGGHEGTALLLTTFTDPTGRVLVAAAGRDDGSVRVWDPSTGEEAAPPITGDLCGVFGLTTLAAPDGQTLIVSGGGSGWIRMWDPATGARVGPLVGRPFDAEPFAIVIGLAAVGRDLVASIENTGVARAVRIWDLRAGRQAGRTLRGHRHGSVVLATVPTADGPLLATGGVDGTVRIWDPVRTVELHRVVGVGAVSALAGGGDPARPLVAIGSDTGLHLLDLGEPAREP